MSVTDILNKRSVFSFEVFPPRTELGMEKLCGRGGVLEKLYTLNPDYISCTYGAGGTNVGKNLEVLDKIVADGKEYSDSILVSEKKKNNFTYKEDIMQVFMIVGSSK